MASVSDNRVQTIVDLVTSTLSLPETTTISRVVEIWDAHPGEDGMAVVGGPHVRYVSRLRFFHQLGKRFGYAVYENRPISLLAEEASIVEADMEPVEAIALATQREASRIYDDIVVLDRGTFRGLVSVRSLLVHHKQLVANGIAERVLLEERNRQLLDLNRQQAEFMAGLTQELCRPIHTMLGLVSSLGADAETRERHGRSLEALLGRGQELLAIVDDLQDLAKLERGELDPLSEPVDVAALIENTVAAASPLLAARSLRIQTAVGDLPASIVVDPLFLRRILGSLLAAVAALTPEGVVVLTAERAGDELVFCVGGADLQADDVEGARGPSLRLSAARSLVGRLGGAVQLVTIEEAAYFRVSLPLAVSGS